MFVQTRTMGLVNIPEDDDPPAPYGPELFCPNHEVKRYFAEHEWQDKIAARGDKPPRGVNQKAISAAVGQSKQLTFGELIAGLIDDGKAPKFAAWCVWNMVNNGQLRESGPRR